MLLSRRSVFMCVVVGALRCTGNEWYSVSTEPLQDIIHHIVKELSQHSKCMVFMIDPFYRRLISYNWSDTALISYYGVILRENEDLDPPQKKTEIMLIRSKDAGCDAYVILIANGLQVSNLLRYAERKRIINAQGNYILMYDRRLFGPTMKSLWNRIINVIFIRQLNFFKSQSNGNMPRRWLNIETVHYPIKIEGPIRTYYVDTWYKGSMRYGNIHFGGKTTFDLQAKNFNVAIFEHIPAVTKYSRELYDDCSKKIEGASGIEFELMKIISKKMNFRPIFSRQLDIGVKKWGTTYDNQSVDGLIGEIIHDKADFLLGDLHYTLKHYELFDLSYPYNSECLTFLTPESLTRNSWKLLILPFRFYTWIAVTSVLLLCAHGFRMFALFYQTYILPYVNDERIHEERIGKIHKSGMIMRSDEGKLTLFTEVQNSLLYTCGMLLQVSLPRLPNAWALRVFIGCWWIYTILVTVAYRASMTASLANPITRMTIDSIGQLAKSTIAVGGWSEDIRELFVLSMDNDLNIIGEKFESTINEEEAIRRVSIGELGYFENVYVLQEARAKRQVLEDAKKKKAIKNDEKFEDGGDLHIMEECIVHMPISIGMDRNSPLKSQVDQITRVLVETGLVEKWLSDVMEWSKIAEIRYDSDATKALVSIHKLYGALVVLALGYFLGLLAMTFENVHWKYFVMRDPSFDKYHMDSYYKLSKKY